MKLSTAERCACLPDLRTLPVWLQSNAGPPTGQAYPLYRIRGPHELEPVTLRVGGEVQDLQVNLRSVADSVRVQLVVHNASTQHTIQVLWLSFEGNEVAYGTVPPQASHELYTFRSHPWIFREMNSRRRMNVQGDCQVGFASSDCPDLVVSEPPRVVWSEATHAEFARDFRAATAALLLCLHRLGAPRDPGADDRGCLYLPPALARRIIELAAPADVWQDVTSPCAAARAELRPVELHGRMLAPVDELLPAGNRRGIVAGLAAYIRGYYLRRRT